MHAINGYLYCNSPTLQMKPGETRRVIIMGFGSEVDMHSPVFVGQSVSHMGALDWQAERTSLLGCADDARLRLTRSLLRSTGSSIYSPGVMPATTFVVDVQAGSAGAWDYYCNILDHINAGMKGRIVVG